MGEVKGNGTAMGHSAEDWARYSQAEGEGPPAGRLGTSGCQACCAACRQGRPRQELPWRLQILPAGASKGRGVKQLLEHLNVKPERVLALGDGEYDVSKRHCSALMQVRAGMFNSRDECLISDCPCRRE